MTPITSEPKVSVASDLTSNSVSASIASAWAVSMLTASTRDPASPMISPCPASRPNRSPAPLSSIVTTESAPPWRLSVPNDRFGSCRSAIESSKSVPAPSAASPMLMSRLPTLKISSSPAESGSLQVRTELGSSKVNAMSVDAVKPVCASLPRLKTVAGVVPMSNSLPVFRLKNAEPGVSPESTAEAPPGIASTSRIRSPAVTPPMSPLAVRKTKLSAIIVLLPAPGVITMPPPSPSWLST